MASSSEPLQPVGHLLPVDQIPPVLHELGAPVTVIDIIGVFPNVDRQQRFQSPRHRVAGIGLITGRFRMVHDKGGCVYAVHVNETIDRILLMSGIYRILKKMDSLDAIKKEMVKGGYYE